MEKNAQQAIASLTARHSESQSILLKQESQRLDKWAEDKIKASEQEIADIDEKIKQIKRDKNQARNLEELAQIEGDLKNTERQRRRLRQSLFDVQDEIEEQRDELFSRIQSQLTQDTKIAHLFTIQWTIN
ncbi:Uncharacterised protein [Moraxella ovis]|uniref:Uncharacterized protein n=1 Tax=Moraxella ovis TaxID=29433 RepID=A0A378PMD5_9GAMM|nr:hypothetical protein [Moraxella ovis]STY87885.1 Uncharacterised protein [Moraxella ovis]